MIIKLLITKYKFKETIFRCGQVSTCIIKDKRELYITILILYIIFRNQ